MKVGVLLPSVFDLGLLRRARLMSLLISSIEDADGSAWTATIGLPQQSEAQWRTIERELRRENASTTIRHLQWEPVPVDNARRMFANLPASLDLEGIDEVCVPRDWGWNFQDCDALIVFADPAIGAVMTLAPTAYYCPDLAVRIVPESAAVSVDDDYWRRQTDAFRMWRQSTILTSDPATVEDVVGYAGVRRERIQLVPNILDIAPIEAKAANGSMTLAWLIGSAALHDLKNAAKGLQTYLSESGGLEPIIVRDGLREAESSAVPFYSEGLPQSVADLLYGLPTQTVNSERELFRLLARTSGIWSSRVAGGEGEMPLLAGELGLPFLGADYECNRSFAAADSALYSLNDPLAIADALHAFEEELASATLSTTRRPKVPIEEKQDVLRNVIRDLSERGVGT